MATGARPRLIRKARVRRAMVLRMMCIPPKLWVSRPSSSGGDLCKMSARFPLRTSGALPAVHPPRGLGEAAHHVAGRLDGRHARDALAGLQVVAVGEGAQRRAFELPQRL